MPFLAAAAGAGAVAGWASGTALLEWAGVSDDDVEPARGGAGPAVTPPAATQRAGPAGPTPPVDAPVTCDGAAGKGDVDGDGAADRVMHRFVSGAAVLQVCLADGRADQLPGLGQTEVLQLLDVARGGTGTFDGDRWSAVEAWGCTDLDGDGQRELVTARADLVDDHYEATFTGHLVEDGRASITTRSEARLPVTSDPFAESNLGACR